MEKLRFWDRMAKEGGKVDYFIERKEAVLWQAKVLGNSMSQWLSFTIFFKQTDTSVEQVARSTIKCTLKVMG